MNQSNYVYRGAGQRECGAQTVREKDSDTFECVCMCVYMMGACRWWDSVEFSKSQYSNFVLFKMY